MIEEAIYSISNNFTQVIIFLGLILLIGLVIYIITGKFDIHKKRIMYCGLLTGLNKRQILTLCAILIRTFCIIYSVLTYNRVILVSLIMILISDIIYMILTPKKILFETINIIAQIIFIYLINVLKTYKIEISNDMYVGQITLVLSVFMIIYSTYFFLKNFEETIRRKKKKSKSKKGKIKDEDENKKGKSI